MKKVIPLLLFIYISCHPGEGTNKPSRSNTDSATTTLTSIDANTVSTLNEASDLAKTIIENVEQMEMNKITKKQLDEIARPLQKQLDSLRLKMTPSEIKVLDDYRTQLVMAMVDRKVARDNK